MKTQKLKELALAATPSRWIRLQSDRHVYGRLEDGCRGVPIVAVPYPFSKQEGQDLDYIAAACPSNILALIDSHAELLAALNALLNTPPATHSNDPIWTNGIALKTTKPAIELGRKAIAAAEALI